MQLVGSKLNRDRLFVAVVLGVAALLLLWLYSATPEDLGPTATQVRSTLPGNYNNAAWIWDSPLDFGLEEFTSLTDFAKQNNIKNLYLFIEDYLATSENGRISDEEKTTRLNRFNEKVESLISIANSRGIEVEALAGDVTWGESTHEYIPFTLLDYVREFNAASEQADFAGIQFDIEFWNHSNFRSDKTRYTNNFLSLVKRLADEINSSQTENLRLGFTIPQGLEREDGLIPRTRFNDDMQSPIDHLLDILGDTNSYLVVMAYRNFTEGNNGSIKLSKAIVDLAEDHEGKVKILVGIETQETSPSHITFFGKERWEVNLAAKQIAEAFLNKEVFEGVVVHTLQGYKDLK